MDDGDPELAAAIALSLGLSAGGVAGDAGNADVTDTHEQRTSTVVATPSTRGGWLASPAPAASAEGSPDVFVGRFSRRPIGNAWHGGTITLSVQGRLRWDNDAGVSDRIIATICQFYVNIVAYFFSESESVSHFIFVTGVGASSL